MSKKEFEICYRQAAWPYGSDDIMDTLTKYTVDLQAKVDELQEQFKMLPIAPPGYKWTWETEVDRRAGVVIRCFGFRLIPA